MCSMYSQSIHGWQVGQHAQIHNEPVRGLHVRLHIVPPRELLPAHGARHLHVVLVVLGDEMPLQRVLVGEALAADMAVAAVDAAVDVLVHLQAALVEELLSALLTLMAACVGRWVRRRWRGRLRKSNG